MGISLITIISNYYYYFEIFEIPVNFARLLKTPFLQNTYGGLLLAFSVSLHQAIALVHVFQIPGQLILRMHNIEKICGSLLCDNGKIMLMKAKKVNQRKMILITVQKKPFTGVVQNDCS